MKTKYTIGIGVVVVLGFILFVISNTDVVTKTAYTNINSVELQSMLQSKDFKLINVHIPYDGEIEQTDMFIPFDEIGDELNMPKDEKIVLYCRSGGMSKVASEELAELGYTNVYNLEEGMNEWKTQGFELLNKKERMMQQLPEKPFQEYNPSNAAYFAMGPSNLIKIVDTISGEIVDVLPAGNNPHGIAVSPTGEYVFTTSTKMGSKEMMMEPDHVGEPMNMEMMMKLGSNEITITSSEQRIIIKRIDVGGGTHHMAITSDGKYVLATVPSKSGIVLIDVDTLELSAFIETGAVPNYVAVSPDGNTAYVSNKGENTLGVVDLRTGTLSEKINTGVRPDHIAISPDGSKVYVTEGGADQVSVIDTEKNEVIQAISVGEAPHGIAITPDGEKVYVANSESRSISVIKTSTLEIYTIDVEEEIEHIEVTPDGKKVYANSEEKGTVYVLNTATDIVEFGINVGAEPHQMSFPKKEKR